ncbi:hypothetical protein E4T56_gene11042 [Termitomyces sp. T112]|nr:hypothetical protein E4T56_gene11042 [Termitomyces sp. T112]
MSSSMSTCLPHIPRSTTIPLPLSFHPQPSSYMRDSLVRMRNMMSAWRSPSVSDTRSICYSPAVVTNICAQETTCLQINVD